jgi:hypothetical protein
MRIHKILIVLAGTIFSLSNGFAGEDGLIAHWPINEGTGTEIKDVSGNNHQGVLLNAENSKWVEGRTGKALLFDNSKAPLGKQSCISVSGMDQYDFSKGVTIEVWIKRSPTAKREAMYTIAGNAVDSRGPGISFMISWNCLLFQSGDGKPQDTIFWQAVSGAGNGPIALDQWYHVAGTYDGSAYAVFINGVKAAEGQKGAKLTKGRDIFSIGAFGNGYADGFDGIISDVKIYNKAKSPLEIVEAAKGL